MCSVSDSSSGGDAAKKRPPGRMRRVSMALGIGADVEDRSRSLLNERFDHCFFIGDFNYRLEMEVKDIKHFLSISDRMTVMGGTDGVFEQEANAAKMQYVEVAGEPHSDVADLAARAMRLEMAQIKTSASLDDGKEDQASEDEVDDEGDDEDDDAAVDGKTSRLLVFHNFATLMKIVLNLLLPFVLEITSHLQEIF